MQGILACATASGKGADCGSAALKAAKKALDAGDVKKAESLINEAKDIIKADASQAGKTTGTTTSKSPAGGSQTGGTIAGSQKDIVQHTAPPGVNQPAIKQETKFPTNTDKTGQLGDKPAGARTEQRPDANTNDKRGIRRENDSAEILANTGYSVYQNPKVIGSKNPDYLIEGRVFDNYAPGSTTSIKNIMDVVSEKAHTQAPRIVLNLQDAPNVSRHALREYLNTNPISGLQEIIIIDQYKNVIRFYP